MKLPALTIAPDHRSLVTADGRAFFYLADTAWELFHRLTLDEALHYLRTRAAQGFNAIQAVGLAELDGLHAPTPAGHTPLVDDDPTRPCEAYWQHVDAIVATANDLGLYVTFLPTWGDKWHRGHGVGPEIFTAENAFTFGRWLGHRYAEADIIWMLGGDRPLRHEADVAVQRAMAAGLREGDGGRHLRTLHPPGGQSSSRYVHTEPWLDIHCIQSGHDRGRASYDMLAYDWSLLPTRPVINAEPPYEAHPNAFRGGEAGWLDQHDVRRELYWAICEGAAGFTYGVHAIWQFWNGRGAGINRPLAAWHDSLDLPGAHQMRIGAALALARPFLDREPASQHLQPLPNTPVDAMPRAVRGRDGTWALIYLAGGQSLRANLEALVPKPRRWTWIDPRNGHTLAGNPEPANETAGLIHPPVSIDGRDWVLLLDAAAAGHAPLPARLS